MRETADADAETDADAAAVVVRGVREVPLEADHPRWAGLGVTLTKSAKLNGWEGVGVESSW